MSPPLPSFSSPPVTEVVIASRFRPPSNYSLVTLGELARTLGAEGFPRIEEMPGYDATAEQFGSVQTQGLMSFEFLSGPPPTRYWFLNDVGDELLQLQPNWFAANWRKVEPSATYGRWDSRWEAFSRWIQETERTISGSPLEHDQVEVTYVNHIDSGQIWNHHGEAHQVFSFLAGRPSWTVGFLPTAEGASAEMKFEIPGGEVSAPIGRLQVTVTPAFRRPGGAPIFVMNLTARGRPVSADLEGVRGFAEIAHEWIVRGFADLTTSSMHEIWDRTT